MTELRDANIDLSHLPIYIISASDKKTETLHKTYLQELIDHSNSDIKKLVEYQKLHYIHITDPDIVINDLKKFIAELEASAILKPSVIN